MRKGIDGYGDEIVGFRDGWRGVLEDSHSELTIESTRGILPRGGTILGSSRTNPYKRDDGPGPGPRTFDKLRLDGLIAIGGEDTLGVANRLHNDGVHVIGVPKTIDNDLGGTDVTFGFDTALQIATEAIDRLHTTAESHNRILVVEVMGRTAGWIALHSGVAGGADVILIPEIPFDIDEVCGLIQRRHARGRYFSIVVAAEGATPKEGDDAVAEAGSSTSSATRGSAGSAMRSSARSRAGPASRPARPCSDTSSAAAPPRRSTACWRPGSASPRSTLRTRARGARWRRCGPPRSRWWPSRMPSPRSATSPSRSTGTSMCCSGDGRGRTRVHSAPAPARLDRVMLRSVASSLSTATAR